MYKTPLCGCVKGREAWKSSFAVLGISGLGICTDEETEWAEMNVRRVSVVSPPCCKAMQLW